MANTEYTQLIEFLGRKFEEIDRRFESIDRRFDRVEAKLAEHDERFERIDERFREVFGHFDHLYNRLERLEQEYQALLEGLRRIEALLAEEKTKREDLDRGLEFLKRQVAALQSRIEAVEQALHQRGEDVTIRKYLNDSALSLRPQTLHLGTSLVNPQFAFPNQFSTLEESNIPFTFESVWKLLKAYLGVLDRSSRGGHTPETSRVPYGDAWPRGGGQNACRVERIGGRRSRRRRSAGKAFRSGRGGATGTSCAGVLPNSRTAKGESPLSQQRPTKRAPLPVAPATSV